MAEAVNKHFAPDGPPLARAENSAVVAVVIPAAYTSRPVEFVAEMESLTVEADHLEKIVINEKTGTIVLGKDVKLSPVAILHGVLSVEVRTVVEVSQPEPLAQQGATAIVPQTTVNTKEEKAKSVVLEKDATVEQLVRALQAIGSTPRDIIAILENMRTAGALDAEIEVI